LWQYHQHTGNVSLVAVSTLDSSAADVNAPTKPCLQLCLQKTYKLLNHQSPHALQVREQRVSNLLQSLLLAVCLGITPVLQRIPTAVLWGYFVFMAVESLAGSQLWERLLLLLTDPKRRVAVIQQEHAAYLQVRPAHAQQAAVNPNHLPHVSAEPV
jgi:hypothetical protein